MSSLLSAADEKRTFGERAQTTQHRPFKDHILFDKLYDDASFGSIVLSEFFTEFLLGGCQ